MTTCESVVDAVREALDGAERAAREYGAFVSVLRERAMAEAAERERETPRGPLHGVPIAVKDNIDVAGAWTRCGTPGFGHRRAEHDAAVVARLRAAGAVVVGKTRMHELAWGMTTPGCRNPRDATRTAGGSSGGSAAAVAAGAVPIALGTDTGGSVRNPAALCGVVGVKTAAGSLPLDGVAPLAPTQDTVGVLARGVDDARLALRALGLPSGGGRPGRVGVVVEGWARRVEPDVAAAVEASARALADAGVEVAEVRVRHSELAAAASYVTMLAEASRAWWRPDEPPEPGALGKDVRRLLRTGTRVAEPDYARALAVREAIRTELGAVLGRCDALLFAACPVRATPMGQEVVAYGGRDVPVETAHSALTSLASVSGLPAMSVPAPDDGGLPVGVQLVAADTGTLCELGGVIERARVSTPRCGAQR